MKLVFGGHDAYGLLYVSVILAIVRTGTVVSTFSVDRWYAAAGYFHLIGVSSFEDFIV